MYLLYQTLFCALYASFFFNDTATTEIYTLSLHDALPICTPSWRTPCSTWPRRSPRADPPAGPCRSEEHTSELQSLRHLVCRLLLEKKKKKKKKNSNNQNRHKNQTQIAAMPRQDVQMSTQD